MGQHSRGLRRLLPWVRIAKRRANRAQEFRLRLFQIHHLRGDTRRAEKRICSQLQGCCRGQRFSFSVLHGLTCGFKAEEMQAAAYKPAS